MMKELPIEVLSDIFSYLDFSSRREASLVCRAWYEASLDPLFLKKTKYTFDASVLEEEKNFTNGTNIFSGCLCKSPNLHIIGLDENFNANYFLKLHESGMGILGPHVEHLSLKNSSVLEGTLIKILKYCVNIKSLDLSGCNALFMSGSAFSKKSERLESAKECLQNIIALNLSSSRFMNDATMCQLFDICPKIESINLSANNLICNSLGISKTNTLTFLVVLQLISLKASNITHVDFSRTSIVSDALSMLAITKHLKLKSVVLQYCRELTDKGVVSLVSHQTDIEYLDLSASSEIGNHSVCAICDNLKKLEVLKLRKCSKVTSASVKNLNKLENLRELDISECHDINMGGLQCGLNGMEQLRTLQLKCCNLSRFNESFFLPLSSGNDSLGQANSSQNNSQATFIHPVAPPSLLTYALQHLDIGSSQYVDDVTLQAVNVHLVNLRVLRLSWSPSITDRGLLGLEVTKSVFMEGGGNPTQEELIREFLSSEKYSSNHSQSGLIKKPGVEFIPDKFLLNGLDLVKVMEERGIVRLKKLRELRLVNCKKLSPVGLLHTFKYKSYPFPDLETLDLGMLHQAVEDETLQAISTSPQLRSLSIAFCSRVTDDGMRNFCKQTRSLDTLNLSNCDGITEKTIRHLSQHCPWLKDLDISMCRRLSPHTVNQVKDQVPSLLRLHTRYSGGASLDQTL